MSRRVHLDTKPDAVLRIARRQDPVGAVNELIWNGLDAEASHVEVELILNGAQGVEGVVVRDDGHGMPHSSCETYFANLGGSWKATAKTSETLRRTLNGKNGQGRLRGFALGAHVEWSTVADNLTAREHTTIIGSASHPADFEIDGPRTVGHSTGTEFRSSFAPARATFLVSEKALAGVTSEFAQFLLAHPDVTITYNGAAVDPQSAMVRSAEYELKVPDLQTAIAAGVFDGTRDSSTGRPGHGRPVVRVVEWLKVSGRELALCDASGVTLATAPPAIQAPGFQFTAYVLWDGFRDHVDYLALADFEGEVVGPVVEAARNALREHFRAREVEKRREQVAQWRADDVYPYDGDPATAPQAAERDAFDFVATTVARFLPRPRKNKKATLRLMRELVANEPSAVIAILDDLYALTKKDKDDLSQLLDRTPLSTLIGATTEVTNRLDFLAALKLMVFDPEHNKVVKERKELHQILAAETWVFGEHFDLMVSDRSLDAVLARHLEAIGRRSSQLEPVRRSDGRVGIVDLMLGRAQRASERREHLVVELKAPKVKITQTEIVQIKSYAEAVASDPQFAGAAVQWDFWVIGTELDGVVKREVSQKNQPKGLISEWDNVRIWAKEWSEVVADCEVRLQYFTEALQHDPANEHASGYLERAHADVIPQSLRSASAGTA